MPISIRGENSKAQKIAFRILGTPSNLQKKRLNVKQRKLNQLIADQDTRLVR